MNANFEANIKKKIKEGNKVCKLHGKGITTFHMSGEFPVLLPVCLWICKAACCNRKISSQLHIWIEKFLKKSCMHMLKKGISKEILKVGLKLEQRCVGKERTCSLNHLDSREGKK